jgi:hypothetical protein
MDRVIGCIFAGLVIFGLSILLIPMAGILIGLLINSF